MLRKWRADDESDANDAFSMALDDIDQAYLEIAEMNLKGMAAARNSAALIFFLKSRHRDYKPTNKLLNDDARTRKTKVKEWSSESGEKKANQWGEMMGVISTNHKDEDVIDETKLKQL